MATLNAQIRETGGKGFARKLRRSGQIPATAYGHGQAAQSLSVDERELALLLSRVNYETTLIDLTVDGGRPAKALIREVQRHPSRPFILHVDLFKIRAGEKLHVAVPIRLIGNPAGVRDEGGVLQESMHELTVECLPEDIPASIDVDIEDLQLGQSVYVSQLSVPNAVILNDGEVAICSVTMPIVPSLGDEDTADGADAEGAEGGSEEE